MGSTPKVSIERKGRSYLIKGYDSKCRGYLTNDKITTFNPSIEQSRKFNGWPDAYNKARRLVDEFDSVVEVVGYERELANLKVLAGMKDAA